MNGLVTQSNDKTSQKALMIMFVLLMYCYNYLTSLENVN